MNRRLVLLAAAVASVAALATPATANADTVSPGVDVQAAERYWACVAVDYVEVGTCVSNPFPDLSGYPTVPDLVHDLTGVRLPTVPRP